MSIRQKRADVIEIESRTPEAEETVKIQALERVAKK